ncbi:MAG: Ni/Fe-hydrogenase subunit HybB-like protein [Cognaticolwellia sp.]|jgi:Ni/Fe-hydrogenase subunit HybB-like protein
MITKNIYYKYDDQMALFFLAVAMTITITLDVVINASLRNVKQMLVVEKILFYGSNNILKQ